ncbi:MAG: hypothetical protein H0T40_07750 [Geodermatophilaceae bacterium]|nr:hypothetical protein [Geodermatophilaceae bacterium]
MRVLAGEAGLQAVIHGHYLQDWLSRASARLCARTSTVGAHRGGPSDPDTANPMNLVDTEDAVSLSFVTDGGVLGSAVICQVAAGRKNRLYVEVSGTETWVDVPTPDPHIE